MIRPGVASETPPLREIAARVEAAVAQLPRPDELVRAARSADIAALVGSTPTDRPLPSGDAVPSIIDHTLLRPQARLKDVERLCEEARGWGFFSVCVSPRFVPLAVRLLEGSPVRVTTVIGFPHGTSAPAVKTIEAAVAVAQGAREVDMVLAIGELKSGAMEPVALEIALVVRAVQAADARVKVILETSLLTPAEQVIACLLARSAGAHFVKTSTGFGPHGATVDDVRRMRGVVGESLGVKASGGIRTRSDLEAMLKAGATRIGTSNAVKIMKEYGKQGVDRAGPHANRHRNHVQTPRNRAERRSAG